MTPARRQPPTEPIVLIVDDDPDARQIYGTFLRSKGWTAFTAVDGRSGIDKAIELKPDAIVLDLAMSRVDGWTVLKELRGSSWTADIPIVVVSALQDARDDALRVGADAYLMKPCDPDVVWTQITALLRIRHQRSKLALS
jgi:DNA-binding response OmpR family regulator